MNILRYAKRLARATLNRVFLWHAKYIKTPASMKKNAGKTNRMLDIGPGAERIAGFETLNVTWGNNVDYLADASVRVPFPDGTFSLVHASHVLEHIPWYDVPNALSEWVRVLEKGGALEIWVPNGYKLAQFLVDIESDVEREEWLDGWRPRAMAEDPYKWLNGRLLYGVRSDYPSWHQAVLTPKFLMQLMEDAGLNELQLMDESEVRSVAHGWINLGVRGTKL